MSISYIASPQQNTNRAHKLLEQLAIVLMLWMPPLQAGLDHNEIKALRDAGKILPLLTILQMHRKHHQGGRMLEAELELEHGRYVYELKVLHNNGVVLEIEYDATTGELYEIEVEAHNTESATRDKDDD